MVNNNIEWFLRITDGKKEGFGLMTDMFRVSRKRIMVLFLICIPIFLLGISMPTRAEYSEVDGGLSNWNIINQANANGGSVKIVCGNCPTESGPKPIAPVIAQRSGNGKGCAYVEKKGDYNIKAIVYRMNPGRQNDKIFVTSKLADFADYHEKTHARLIKEAHDIFIKPVESRMENYLGKKRELQKNNEQNAGQDLNKFIDFSFSIAMFEHWERTYDMPEGGLLDELHYPNIKDLGPKKGPDGQMYEHYYDVRKDMKKETEAFVKSAIALMKSEAKKKKLDSKDSSHGSCEEKNNDHPDDNFDVSSYTQDIYDQINKQDIAIISNGFSAPMSGILASIDEPAEFQDIEAPLSSIENFSVVIIPSGGLYGLDSSPSFRSKLDKYVSDGGTLIAFSQQHGYEFKALPGGLVSGFGWLEDQSCLMGSVGMTTYNPIFSGQASSVINANVDGFFTEYPENATILLTRTKNAMPAMLMYGYGKGRVIATTAFTDWAYGYGAQTQDEIGLIRNLITWAKYPEEIPDYGEGDSIIIPLNITNNASKLDLDPSENYSIYHPGDIVNIPVNISYINETKYRPGETVNIPLNITNFWGITSDKIIFTVFDAEYNPVNRMEVPVIIAVNETKIVNFLYNLPVSSKPGTWIVDYSLLDANGISINNNGFILKVTNVADITPAKVAFTLYDTDFNMVNRSNTSITIDLDETKSVNFMYHLPVSSSQGEWIVTYALLNAKDEIIQEDFTGELFFVDFENLIADRIVFAVKDPNKNLVQYVNISTSLDQKEIKTINFTYKAPSIPGIWSLDYSLMNNDSVLQTVPHAQRFAISKYARNPNGWVYQGNNITFSVTSDEENYLYGSKATFTFNIWNRGNIDKNIKVTWGSVHHSWYGIIPPGWDNALNNTILVPKEGYASFTYILPKVVDLDRLRAKFYDGSTFLGDSEKGIWMLYPKYEFSVQTPKKEYSRGEEVSIRAAIINGISFAYNLTYNLTIYDPDSQIVFTNITQIPLLANSNQEVNYKFPLFDDVKDGMYRISMSQDLGRLNGYDSTNFIVMPPSIQLINKSIPEIIFPGSTQPVSFKLKNVGGTGNTTFNISFKNDTQILYDENKSIWLSKGEEAYLNYSIPIKKSDHVYGNNFIITYNGDKINGGREYPSSMNVLFDIESGYREGDNLTFKTSIFNTGKIPENFTFNLSVPGLGYNETLDLSLFPGTNQSKGFSQKIMPNFGSGAYDIIAEIGENKFITHYFILPPVLSLQVYSEEYSSGENVSVGIENFGGSSTGFNLSILLIDSAGRRIADVNETGWIFSRETKNYQLQIPAQATSGKYYLIAWAGDGTKKSDLLKTITIKGLESVFGLETTKKTYLSSEDKIVLSSITNGNKAFENSNLHMRIVRRSSIEGVWQNHTPPWEVPDFGELEIDDNGDLWLGTNRNYFGILKYNSSSGIFERYTNALENGVDSIAIYNDAIYASNYVNPGIAMLNASGLFTMLATNTGLPSEKVSGLDADSNGVWIATGDGVSHFDGSLWTKYNYSNTGLDLSGIIQSDNHGGIWTGGYYGWTHFNGITGEIYDSSITNSDIGQLHKIKVDHNNNTYFMGLTSLGYPTNIVKFNGTQWTKVPDICPYSLYFGSGYNYIADIDVAPDGTLWAACYQSGAYSVNTTGTFHYAKSNSGLPTNELTAVKADADKVIFGAKETLSGYGRYNMFLSIYNGTWLVYNSLNSNIPSRNLVGNSNLISSIEISPDRTIWLGHVYGLSKLENGIFTNYFNTGTINSNDIYSISKSSNGDIWFAGSSSIDKFNGTWSGLSNKDSFMPFGSSTLFSDSKGRLWESIADYGILRFNGSGWRQYNSYSNLEDIDFVESANIPYRTVLLVENSSGVIIAFDEQAQEYIFNEETGWSKESPRYGYSCAMTTGIIDKNDNVWFIDGSCNSGILKLDTARIETKYLDSEDISALAIDGSGRIWAAGLNKTAKCQGEETCVYTSSIQLFVQDGQGLWTKFESQDYGGSLNQIYRMKFDKTGRLWITTNLELFSFAPDEGTGNSELLWENNDTINLAPTETLPGEKNAGTLGNANGKFLLHGTLTSSTGQIIANKEYTFYSIKGNTSLETELDKKIFRPDEIATLKERATNYASIALENVMIKAEVDGTEIYNEQGLTIPPGDHFDFQIKVPVTEGSHTIRSEISQQGTVLVEIQDDYKVSSPSLLAEVTIPEVVGIAPFFIDVLLTNNKDVNASANVTTDGYTRSESLMPGEIRLVRFEKQMNATSNITVNISGDLNESTIREVVFGESALVSMNISKPYMPGQIIIPYQVENNGLLDVRFNLTFSIKSSTETREEVREIYLPEGENFTGLLSYDLISGEYTLNYSSIYGSESKVIRVAAQGLNLQNLSFIEEEGALVVSSIIRNIGGDNFTGNVQLSSDFYLNNSNIEIEADEEINLSFFIDTTNVSEGSYTITFKVLEDGIPVSVKSGEVHLRPEFIITSIPNDLNFSSGETRSIYFNVRNNGTTGGFASINVTLQGIETQYNSSWILPGEEVNLSFFARIPDDLEEKSYKVFYDLNGNREETSFFVEGAKIDVNASLDKNMYIETDTAILNIEVKNLRNFDLELFSRVKFNEYDSVQHFNLTGLETRTLRFDVPVNFSGDKIFYSVYMASGRSLYINSMRVYEKPNNDSGLTLLSDKQVYNTGENADILVNVIKDGTLNLTAPGFTYTKALKAGDSMVINFLVPELKTGTYTIDYTFDNVSFSYPFEVNGYFAKILEVTMDKELYNAGDSMNIKMLVEANRNFPGTMKFLVYGKGTEDSFEFDKDFVKGENNVEINRILNTSWSGIHSVEYDVYANLTGSNVLLASGSEYFDVVDKVAPLITITSPQNNFSYATSSVALNFDIEDTSDIDWIRFSIDDLENITISGNMLLTNLGNGDHKIIIYAKDSAGNVGSGSVSFNVNVGTLPSAIPPFAVCGQDKLKCENVGTPVQFNGSASYDPDSTLISYYWDFGDGTNGTGAVLNHTYAAHEWNGTAYEPFIVNLTVTDDSGLKNSTSQKVVIWIAGDANGDGNVNILDASVVGLKWDGNDACGDLNNDGIVNILDASIIGLNWGKSAYPPN